MENPAQLEIDTPDGVARLEKIYFTELGYVMAKFYYPKKKQWINYRLGDISEMLNDCLPGSRKLTNFKKRIAEKILI